jgi:hypothetical protein
MRLPATVLNMANHGGNKARLLVFIHADDLLPIICHFRQTIIVAQVNQVENVFTETRAAEANAGSQKMTTDAAVGADGMRHFSHVGFCFSHKAEMALIDETR